MSAAVVCSVLAVPIILALDGRPLLDGHDLLITLVDDKVDSFALASALTNLLTSLSDKLISGFAALVAVAALPLAFRHGLNVVGMSEPSVSD